MPPLLIDYNALIPAPLVWGSDVFRVVLMLSGLGVALIPTTLVLRARRKPVVQPRQVRSGSVMLLVRS
jgi:hypothetical protein